MTGHPAGHNPAAALGSRMDRFPESDLLDDESLSVIFMGLGTGGVLAGIVYLAIGLWPDFASALIMSSAVPYALGGRMLIDEYYTPRTTARIGL